MSQQLKLTNNRPINYDLRPVDRSRNVEWRDQSNRLYNASNIPILNRYKLLQSKLNNNSPISREEVFDLIVDNPGYFRNTYLPHLYKAYPEQFTILNHNYSLRPYGTVSQNIKRNIPQTKASDIGYAYTTIQRPEMIYRDPSPQELAQAQRRLPNKGVAKAINLKYSRLIDRVAAYRKKYPGYTSNTSVAVPFIPYTSDYTRGLSLNHQINHANTASRAPYSIFKTTGLSSMKMFAPSTSNMDSRTPGFMSVYTVNQDQAVQAAICESPRQSTAG